MGKITTEVKWALIFFVMMLLWMTGEKIAGLHDENIDKHYIYTNFVMIPAITVYALALLNKRNKDYGGMMSWKQGFASGAVITAIVTLLSPVTQLIINNLISPDYFVNMINYSVEQGIMTKAEAAANFNSGSYIIQGFVSTAVMGLGTSAVVALFVRKKKRE